MSRSNENTHDSDVENPFQAPLTGDTDDHDHDDDAFHVLVVDDEVLWAELLKIVLEEELLRTQVTIALDGDEAIQAIRMAVPDLLILDDVMPRVTGVEVLRELAEQGARFPVIAMSSYRSSSPWDSLQHANGITVEFMEKPPHLDTLVDVVKRKYHR